MKNFKKLALGLIVGAIAIGFSAFKPFQANTYYAIKNPAGSGQPFRWTSNAADVADLSCDDLTSASCEVEADTQPADGQMPSGVTPSNKAFQ